jgi:hypothetical protein
MKGLVQVDEAAKFEQHLCPTRHCSRAFPKIAPPEWREDQVCITCGERRFKRMAGRLVLQKKVTFPYGSQGDLFALWHISADHDIAEKARVLPLS